MTHLLTITLLLTAFVTQTVTAEQRPRNRRKKAKTEVAQPKTTAPPAAKKTVCPIAPIDLEGPEAIEVGPDELMPELSAEQADSLLAAWRERQRDDAYHEFFDNYILIEVPTVDTTPDSIYINRLRALVSPVQLPYNNVVKGYISRYTDSRYGTISRVLGMSQYYFPLIEEELLKANMPVELRALPIIESALQPTAVSRAGATGLWQFMPSTGKSYGLEINSLVDERRDPIRSTQAAVRFLKDLYSIYNDWSLVLAAYNCGPGNVNKALARAGEKSHTFWDIYDYLPRETRGYVPAFIGASYAYAYHQQHGITLSPAPMPLSVDTLRINRLMHLGQIASTIDVPIETLRQLNPQYKLDIIPATTKAYTLILPQRNITQYIAHEAEIFAKDSTYLKEYLCPANLDQKRQEQPDRLRATYYTIKRGDTLGSIARRYHVTTTQLMRWNGIKNAHRVQVGKRLRIER
ncbi:MAG: transglycosylase SLT domain-containing protein [Alistipes sp.]